MPEALTPHPDTPCPAVRRLEADVERTDRGLALRYRLAGDLDALAIAGPAAPARTDGLWEHTCFEAFVAQGGGGYIEINLSPSGQWAAYRFDGYRQGMAPLDVAPPRITVARAGGALELRAGIALPLDGPLRIGLTAVVETACGEIAFWALRHPPGPPDFHRTDGWTLKL